MGSSIVQLAVRSGLQLYPQNLNGNPHYIKTLPDGTHVWGDHIPFWEFDQIKLAEFIDNCKEIGVQLLCSESGFPGIEQISELTNIKFFTVMRDPFKRFVSNFRYDYQEGNTSAKTLIKYYKSIDDPIAHPNYYTNVLSQGSGDFETAKKTLQVFNIVIIQECPETFSLLETLGLNGIPTVFNKCYYRDNDSVAAEYKYFFENVFLPENKNDYKLYNMAKKKCFDLLKENER